jgi:oligopeptide transport system permease protein
MKSIDKSKLVFLHNKEDVIRDQPLETKEIGYYKDSWNRFKRNKASLTAFYIILFVMFFVLFGPFMKVYTLYEDNPIDAGRLQNLTPKIPFIEEFGVFDGTKTITSGKQYLARMYHTEFGEGIILEGFPEQLKEDEFHPDYMNVTQLTVKVDYYKYMNYSMSYLPEGYFGGGDARSIGNNDVSRLGAVTRTLTEDVFKDYLSKNYIIDILAIRQSPVPERPGEFFTSYEVRLNQFLVSLDQLPEDTYFWFGTNMVGKDLFSEIWRGARISIIMAIAVTLINSIIGLTLGSIAGYYGGVFDLLFDRFVEIVSSIPFLVVLTLLILRFGSAIWVIVIAFTATGWIGSYGTGRLQFYRFKNREYVLAARTLGAPDKRIMFKHIFPNTLGLIVTGYALAIPAFVFTEATFSFLGIINYSNVTSVGMLIQEGQAQMQLHPHLLLFPAIYIAILMIAFNLFGNGFRDAFNPALRGVE